MKVPSDDVMSSSINPRKFLRKGEGLKRFAEYKPPRPFSNRRQTFVKFKPGKECLDYVYPELLRDDSVNLSTEVPKIAPPKIMHTPVARRSKRQLRAVVERHISPTFDRSNEEEQESESEVDENSNNSSSQIDGDYDELMRKINEKRASLDEVSDARRVSHKQPTDLSTPSPGNTIIALGRQIDQIQATVNDLKEKLKNCRCGAYMESEKEVEETQEPLPARRSQRLRSKTTQAPVINTKPRQRKATSRQSANAENLARGLVDNLANEILKFREEFQHLNLG